MEALLRQRAQKSRTFPLSYAQQRLWVLERLEPGNPVYNIPMGIRLKGELDIEALQRALNEVVSRHESLRTRFALSDDIPLQVIEATRRQELPVVDLQHVEPARWEATADTLGAVEARRPFDLESGPLFRTCLLRFSPTEHVLVGVMHHIISDGWSTSILFREVSRLYGAYAAGDPSPLQPLPIQYADYAVWQRDHLKAETLERQLHYWCQRLEGAAPLELPSDFSRPAMDRQVGTTLNTLLPASLIEPLKGVGRQQGATLYMTLLSAFQVLLHRYSGQEDIAVGSPIAGRLRSETEALVGCFVNTLVLRSDLSGDPTFAELLGQVRRSSLEAFQHQEVPFERLVEAINPARDTSRHPLFQVLFTLLKAPWPDVTLAGVSLSILPLETGTSKFDLSFTAQEAPEGLSLSVEYNTDLFQAETIQRMVGHFRHLLAGITTDPTKHISKLEFLDDEERQWLLVDCNDTAGDFPIDVSLPQLFAEQVARTPNDIAAVYEDQTLTYQQLHARSNQLAHFLRRQRVGSEAFVGICLNRSLDMLVSVLAVMKAGGAYVPLDPDYPQQRLAMMLEDAAPSVVLTESSLYDRLPRTEAHVVQLDADEEWLCSPATNLDDLPHPGHLAYVIFTSGSTGRPKGVQIEHACLSNFLQSMRRIPGIRPDDVVVAVTTLSFDIATLELYLPLIAGARVVIASRDTAMDGGKLLQLLTSSNATLLQATPATWRLLLASGALPKDLRVLCGGEPFPADLADALCRGGNEVWNMYGPTETTVWSTVCQLQAGERPISIGNPIDNTRVYVLDRALQPVPMGVPGELHIAGDGVARGYLNRKDLTEERFVADPFALRPNQRMYKTGDLVRWLHDGRLEHLGRIDHQVKVRGFRIELGEVQSALAAHPGVEECVVTTFDSGNGNQELAAYWVAGKSAPTIAELRSFLAQSLPDYMIPSVFVVLDSIPLTPNGKVDHKALPEPERKRDSQSDYVSPRTPDETFLADVWREVLQVEQVGIHDDFFALGGHSLLATQVVSRMCRHWNVELPLRELFQRPTVAQLAERMEQLRGQSTQRAFDQIPVAPREGDIPLSLTQESLWFLDQLERDQSTYTVYPTLRLKGRLDTTVLERAINEIFRRHESIRSRFPEVNGRPIQIVEPHEHRSLNVVDLSNLSDSEREAGVLDWISSQTQRPIDLQNGPLIRMTLLRLSDLEHVLVAAAHHIIYDGWSMGVMTRELAAIYAAYREQQPSPLPELAIQYADFAIWQRKYLQGELLEDLEGYWSEQLADLPPLELPTDYSRPAIRTAHGETISCDLSSELSASLREFCRREGVTPFMTLLATLQALLSRYSGQIDFGIGSPVANRMRPETERMIGYFINMVVLRADLSDNPSFRELVQRVQQVAVDAYERQELTLDHVVDVVKPVRDPSRHPLFQVMFVLQNHEPPSFQEMGLDVELVEHGLVRDSSFFDLSLSFEETPEGFQGGWNFNTDLFHPDTARQMMQHYRMLLATVIAEPDRRLLSIPLVNEQERTKQLVDWNDTRLDFPRVGCVSALFESHAQRSPDETAVVGGSQVWTYGELNRRSTQLARHLVSKGVGPETRIGICLESSPELVMAVLAVLKAGGAYVPLDPSYVRGAADRTRFVLNDAEVSLVITQSALGDVLDSADVEQLVLDGSSAAEIEAQSDERLECAAREESLAYVLYTSGSTGQPKGVMVTRGNLLNAYYGWETEYRLLTDVRSHLQMASFGFDVFAGDFIRALCSGGKLVLCPKRILLDPAELVDLLRQERVDAAEFVPVVLRNLVQHLEDTSQSLDFMHLVVVGSDAWYVSDHQRARRVLGPETRLVNSYGLTETTIDSSYFESDVESTPSGLVPIGRPFPNVRLYVLDESLEPTPRGVPGELFIGGLGVTRGYVDESLNATRFLSDPFSSDPAARMCRTGDRVRWRHDGQLEFLGRADDQVKIRGFRIEPGEVEQALRTHPLLAEAAIVPRERGPGDLQLVAYTAAGNGASPSVGEIRQFLRQRLPEYMLPALFVPLADMPTTSNGKVDRRALPAPDWSVAQRECEFVAPRTPVEEQLAAIWSDVLGVSTVGALDGFFDLGGNSLLALRLASKVREVFAIDLPLVSLFTAPVLEELAEQIVALQAAGTLPDVPPIQPVERDQQLPLSYGQEALWVISRLQDGASPYTMFPAARVKGPLNLPALERALNEVLRRHESLRTTFVECEGAPVQVIAPYAAQTLKVVDLGGLPQECREEEVEQYAWAQSRRPMSLSEGPLARVEVLRLDSDEHVVLIGMHHIIYDGWSLQVMSRELFTLYRAFAAGRPSPLGELPVQYADYAAWQRGRLQGEILDRLQSYWLAELEGLPALELYTDRPRPPMRSTDCDVHSFVLPPRLSHKIKNLGRQEGTTLFMTLMAAFQTLLSRYSGQDEFAVGTPVAGRLRPETENLIGFFVNSLVLRADLSSDPTFRELLATVRQTMLGAFEHQELPFERLVQVLNPPRDPSRHPVFQVMLVQQNTQESPQDLGGFELSPLASGPERNAVDFDLTLTFNENPDDIQLSLTYRTDLFGAATIERMAGHFRELLEEAIGNPDKPVSQVSLLTARERQQVVNDWNGADAPGNAECMHTLIQEQAERTPDNVAVAFRDQELTYRELDTRANQLAHYLQKLGVGPDIFVGICMDRGLEVMVGLLGILKAGGAYVPLDSKSPLSRLREQLEDLEAPVVLTSQTLSEQLAACGAHTLCLDTEWDALSAQPVDKPATTVTPDNAAYVIFTSGSTGSPKGVVVEHRQICSYACGLIDRLRIEPGWRFALVQPLFVDSSNTVVFPPLVTGGCLHIFSEDDSLDARVLEQQFVYAGIDCLKIAPTHLAALQSSASAPNRLLPHRRLILGGEQSRRRWLSDLLPSVPTSCQVFNHYGPTETTVGVLTFPASQLDGESAACETPIGRPLPGTRCFILNDIMEPVPVGLPGELYIAGPQVTRGYLDAAALTEERFVPNPFSDVAGSRMYRTGDRCRWLASGNVEFLGRADRQIKIRGFRVEPGEVEATLAEHPCVQASLVQGWEVSPGDTQLAAYVVCKPEQETTAEVLRTFADSRLPSQMVPSSFVFLSEFPRSAQGKINFKALPAPTGHRDALHEYVAPRNPIEESLAVIWCDVLGLEQVGVQDDFFELGGHSLRAIQVMSRLARELNVSVPVRDMFEAPTLEGLAQRVLEARSSGGRADLPPILPVPRDQPLPASYGQEALWMISRLQNGPSPYTMFPAARVKGPLDVPAFERALNEVLRRHELLRTTFAELDGRPVQVIAPYATQTLKVVDLSELPLDGREEEVTRYAWSQSRRPIDLSEGPLARVEVLRLDADEHVVLIGMHHTIYDGWSLQLMSRELFMIYQAFASGRPSPLNELPIQYADYAVWQRTRLQGEVLDGLRRYWLEELNELSALELPTDRTRPPVRSTHGASHAFALSPQLSQEIKNLGRQEGTTLFMTLMAAFQTLLYRYSGQDDFAVGTPVAGRLHPETESLIGFFVNSLVLRADLSGDPSFRELLARVRETALAAFNHQEMPFEKLVQELNPPRDVSRHPVFQVMLVLINVPEAPQEVPGFELSDLSSVPPEDASDFDLHLVVQETDGNIHFTLTYRKDLFDAPTIARMCEHFQSLLQAVVADRELRLQQIPLSTESERQRLLVEWNATDRDYGSEECLHEMVESRVAGCPEAVAVDFEGQQLTFRQLNQRANQLAHYLARYGVGPDAAVGVCLERSPEMVVSLLAVLKAGGAYMPLDPDYPADRLAMMAADCRPPAVITTRSLAARLSFDDVPLVFLDEIAAELTDESCENPSSHNSLDDVAYVIYTSGSTGVPKGVRNTHRGICNRLLWMQEAYRLTPDDRVLQKTPYSFDVSVWEFFWPLLVGARLVVARPGGHKDPRYLIDLIVEQQITTLHFVPSMLRIFLADGEAGRCRSLKRVICSGEALPFELQQEFFASLDAELHNLYGPTEAAVDVTFWQCGQEHHQGLVPIGKPIANMECYILDEQRNPTPLGIAGELYLGGVGLARDYLNRPQLTAERFVPHPFSEEPGARLYRTGDLCRYLPDGNILFLGRLDHQVKIRGNRIELGEIQSVLVEHPAVQTAVVTTFDAGGTPELVAYWVPQETEQDAGVAEFRAFLQKSLPDYMLPGVFVPLDEIPLNASGKVDHKALPQPTRQRDQQFEYVSPRTPDEETLASVWQEVLQLERIGVRDNFFALGGHSLLAVQVVSRINSELDISLPLRDLFESPTIEELARQVMVARLSGVREELPAILPAPRDQPLPAAFSQEELWVIDRVQEGPSPYVLSSAARLSAPLDERALEQSLNEVVRRHESLRTRFADIEGQLVQVVEPHIPRPLKVIDLSASRADRREEEVRRYAESRPPFDLTQGPLATVEVLRLAPDEHVVLIRMHHIVYDGWSMSVLTRELVSAYLAFASGLPSPLEELPIQYADFAAWQRNRIQGEVLERLRNYWLPQLEDLPTLELRTDRPRPDVRATYGAHCEYQLSSRLSRAVSQLGSAQGATPFMTVLAAFQVLLYRYSGQEDFAVGTPVAGRLRPETEGLIGDLTNDLVLRADLSGDPTFRQIVGRVRETVLQAFNYQEMPFAQLVRDLNPRRSLNRYPVIQTELIFQNTPATAVELSGMEWDDFDAIARDAGADLDLSLIAIEADEGLQLCMSYRTDLFDESTIRLMLEQLESLLQAVSLDPDHTLSQLAPDVRPEPHPGNSDRRSTEAAAPATKADAQRVAPRSNVEQQLATIWAEMLGADDVGVHDNFFDLGGYSLLAVQMMARACADLKTELSAGTVFAASTIAELAQRFEAAQGCLAKPPYATDAASRPLGHSAQ